MSNAPEFPSARVERVLPAPPERVYDAWIDERALKAFMCPAPGDATEVAVDARVGGSLRVVMSLPDGQTEINGEFLALDRPQRVCFTWRTAHEDYESVVTVILAPHGADQTHMTIIHTRQPAVAVPRYERGWGSIAERLEAYLAG